MPKEIPFKIGDKVKPRPDHLFYFRQHKYSEGPFVISGIRNDLVWFRDGSGKERGCYPERLETVKKLTFVIQK